MGKVIKRGSSSAPESATGQEFSEVGRRAPIIERSTIEARSQADDIREKAQVEADALLEKAREEAQTIRAQAKDEGYAE